MDGMGGNGGNGRTGERGLRPLPSDPNREARTHLDDGIRIKSEIIAGLNSTGELRLRRTLGPRLGARDRARARPQHDGEFLQFPFLPEVQISGGGSGGGGGGAHVLVRPFPLGGAGHARPRSVGTPQGTPGARAGGTTKQVDVHVSMTTNGSISTEVLHVKLY